MKTTTTIKEYSAKLDSKKRITIRGAKFDHYKVRELENGKIELSPQALVDVDAISPKTLKMIDKSMANFKSGMASKPIDLSEF